jgi:tRNA(Ile)-lysidine synthase
LPGDEGFVLNHALGQASPAKPLSLGEFGASLAALARFEASPFLAVAVSGGSDSLALAILADRWARDNGGEICALTVDHRLRPESGDEIRRLEIWLSARRIRHEVLVWSGEKPKSGIQEAARLARYRLLTNWCREHGCLHLLTAHHREDQIETHLLRRRARSGADGLAGMSAIRELGDCRLLRPLLAVGKDELVAFLQAERQPFIVDPSNFDPAFERSRYRRGDALAGTTSAADLLAQTRALGAARLARQQNANAFLAHGVRVHPAGFAVLDPKTLSAVPDALAERLLAAATTTIGGTSYSPRRKSIARLRGVLAGNRPRGRTVGGCRFIHWRERVLVTRELAHAAGPMRLSAGESRNWDVRFQVIAPPDMSSSVSITYLGAAGVAQLRRLAPRLRRDYLPRLLLPILPTVWDEDGIAAVPHLEYRREGVGAVPQIVFRPVNPLTQADFAVV